MSKKLLIIAGATVTINKQGHCCAKEPIRDYLHEMAQSADQCTWVAYLDNDNDYQAVIDSNRVTVHTIKKGSLSRIKAWFTMLRLALAHDYVMYFLPNQYLPLLPVMRIRAKRIAVYLAGDYEVNIREYADKRWPGWSTLTRWSFESPMRHANIVIARGKRLANMAKALNKKVVETMPMGHMNTEAANSSLGSTPQQHKILFVGKVVESKGVGVLINSFARLVADNREESFVLTIAGEGGDRAKYEALATELKLQDQIVFAGWVSSAEQMETYYRIADVVVVPSIYPEGVPRVIDEAIVRNIPVIATPVGGIAEEFAGGEVSLIEPGNAEALADAIDSILFNKQKREQLLAKAAVRRDFFRANKSAAHQHARLLMQDII